jgi:hypothetical protein
MGRKTDRQALIDLIINAKRTDPKTGSFTEWLADFLLGYGVTLPQPSNELMTGWVSVKERLPEEHKPVLCIVSGKPKSNITLDEAYQLGSWNKADGWIIDEWLDWEDANVSWWCELPEPPDRRPPEGEDGDANHA